jgi:hypothetical protein
MQTRTLRNGPMLAGLALILANLPLSVQAAIYNSPATQTPFSVSLDTGSPAWNVISHNVSSSDSGIQHGSYTSDSSPAIVSEIIPAQIGVAGAINIYNETTRYFYNTTSQSQGFSVGYSASLNGPISVPQTYSLTGMVNASANSSLVNSGSGYTSFSMGLNLAFTEPYVANSGNASLTFHLGAAPGNWSYTFQRDFALASGQISLSDSNYLINLASGPIYYEADYTIGGNSGVTFSITPDLFLNFGGGVGTYSTSLDHTTLATKTLIASVEIPALTVPEPESYAMLLAGLGLLGAAARRRKSN